MSKAEERACQYTGYCRNQSYKDYLNGYHQAEEDLIDKTIDFLKKRLYKDGYIGIIDLCDDYIKAMKDE